MPSWWAILAPGRTRSRAEREWFQPPAEVLARTDSRDAERASPRASRAILSALNTAVAFGAIAPQVAAVFDYAPAIEIAHDSDVWVGPR